MPKVVSTFYYRFGGIYLTWFRESQDNRGEMSNSIATVQPKNNPPTFTSTHDKFQRGENLFYKVIPN